MQEEQLVHWEAQFVSYLRSHTTGDDGSHDLGHFRRVWRTAKHLLEEEQADADPLVLLAAAYFHDIISLPKNDPEAHKSSWLSAQKTEAILTEYFPDFPADAIDEVKHAIHAHSYSAKVQPQTITAKILQDADRMEALGAIGIARTFYTGGRLGTKMFSSEDPKAEHRNLDDKQYSLDHFKVKLLNLPGLMNTNAGKKMAQQRADYLVDFMEQITSEILGTFQPQA